MGWSWFLCSQQMVGRIPSDQLQVANTQIKSLSHSKDHFEVQ